MADTTALKNRIRAAIKANDNQEITGPVLQQVLLDIVDELSDRIIDEYALIEVAIPTTVPPSDLTEYSRVFYLTAQNGVYTNLGGIEVSNEIAIIKYNGTSWIKEQVLSTDGGVFDISVYHATGGTLATYPDLSAALNSDNNGGVPQSLQKSGMSVKFVHSSDNKYVQYFLTKGEWSANEADWEKMNLEEEVSQLGQKVDGIDKKLHESETISPTLLRSGYYVTTNGTRAYYSPFGIFTPIPVKAGDRVVANIDGYNSAASPISWGQTDNTNSDMSVIPLAVYTPTNQYDVIIENDGFLIVCGDKTTTPVVTIYGRMYDFNQIEVNKNNITDLTDRLSVEEKITPPIGKSGYYVTANGGRGDYRIMAIYGPIQVRKGDKVSATNMLSENEIIAALAWSQSPSMDSDMSCVVLALGNSSGDATTEYKALIPDDGYIFLSANKNTTPKLSVASVSSIQPLVDEIKELSGNVADIDGALDDNTQVPVIVKKNGYCVNTSGTRDYNSPFAIFSPVSVKAGDKIIIGNIDVNSAVCPLAFNIDGNTDSDMTSTPMAVYEAGKTSYIAVAPQDGYFIISNDRTKIPSVEIAKLLDIPEIKQIGSLLSGKITMLFGDSLTAGSTPGVVAFGRVIANVLGIPYRAFVYDRFDSSPDTNPADVDIDIPSITNYGKDGTKNQLTTGRVDSVLQRIKNHITADTNVDYVLVECCVNDYTSGTKGTISDSYTGPFDENTAIGAIEETCRYLSTIGKPVRFGFYIPWQISYVPESYFNDYIPVFEKWGVPLFDMRKCAGFDMRNCVRHQELYSLPASSYANYDNSATYNLDDKVKYEGFLYKCDADGVTGILPTNETYWTKVSEGSFDGCHLNSLGHYIVAGKIQSFMERL